MKEIFEFMGNSVKGTIIAVFTIIFLAVMFTAFKDVAPTDESKQQIEDLEKTTIWGFMLYVSIGGILGTITLVLLIKKFFYD